MAEPKYHRLALAQISFNPAYLDDSGVSYLHEPIFPTEVEHGLHKLAGLTEIHDLRARIAATLIEHMSHKIAAIAEFVAGHKAEVLVLPEYSVPPELLRKCMELSQNLHIPIVAGSHIVTRPALAEHARLGIVDTAPESRLGRAVCPVFLPSGRCHIFEKVSRSKWEGSLVPGTQSGPISIPLHDQDVLAEVLICIDAVTESPIRGGRRARGSPLVTFMPSLTPSTELFYSKARLLLAAGRVTLFANSAEFGGSRLFARAEHAKGWMVAADGTEPLPKGSEAVIFAELDLSHQFDVRKSTQEHFPVRDVDIAPLVYADQSGACREFLDMVGNVQSELDPSGTGLQENLQRFAALEYRLFPRLMQDKIKHFLSSVLTPGLADANACQRGLAAVPIHTTTATDLLRWSLCADAIEQVNQLTLSGRYQDKTDVLADTWKYLVNKRNELAVKVMPPALRPAIPSKIAVEAPSAPGGGLGAFEPPFFDRENVLAALQNFMNAPGRSCFVLSGMRGIGKRSIAREALRKVVPANWRRVRTALTEGASYPRLLAELAHHSGLRMPADRSLDSPARQIDLEQNLLLHVSHTPRLAVIIEDLQYLLEPTGEFSDANAARFVSQLIQAASARRNKLVFVTSHLPKLDDQLRPLIEVKPIVGLERKHSEDLYGYWFRFERSDLTDQPVAYPEKLLSVLKGHPLGVKVAAKLVAESTAQRVESDTAIFRRLRETIITFLLDHVELSTAEDELVRFASIFRLPVGRDIFVAWGGDQANFLIDSLVGRSFLEVDGEGYSLHPIIRDHFYTTTPIEVLRPLHRLAGTHFLEKYKKAKADANPDLLGEAIHHFLCAGDRDKVKEFTLYKYELRPVALTQYRKREFDLAFKSYRVLVALDATDPEAHFHLALLYARKNEWDRAEEHFGKAIRLKPKAYWILQGYGHAKMRSGRSEEAEQYFLQALEINPRYAPALTDLARLYARQGDETAAESYFRQAIEADENNAFTYIEYARFLMHTHRYEEGLQMAMAAVEAEPRDQRNRDLVNELRAKIQAAGSAVGAPPNHT